MDRNRLQSTLLHSHPFPNTDHSLHPLIKQTCFRSSKYIFHSCVWWGHGRDGGLSVAASTCKPTIPRTPGKVVPTNRWRLLLGGVIGGSVVAKGVPSERVISCVFLHVFLRVTLLHVCVWDVCGWGVWKGEWGVWQLNSRCLKSVGLTGCHKTAWLMESFGKSSPAVLMNLEPKGLMKRAPFAKTVPQLDLPWPALLPRHLRVGLHGDRPKESTELNTPNGTKGQYREEKATEERVERGFTGFMKDFKCWRVLLALIKRKK